MIVDPDIQKILDLPIKAVVNPMALVEKWTTKLGVPGAPPLMPDQAQALEDIATEGFFGGLGVGAGKTLIGMLAGAVVGAERPVVLMPSNLVPQAKAEYQKWSRWYPVKLPRVLAYEAVSRAGRTDLEDAAPDCIVLDEAHNLSNPIAARSKRFVRYICEHPEIKRIIPFSGSFGVPLQYTHLALMALGDNSPVPYGRIGDLVGRVVAPGTEPSAEDIRSLRPLTDWAGEENTQEGARKAYRQRLRVTPGVTWSVNPSCSKAIHAAPWPVPTTDGASVAMALLDTRWELPCGEQLTLSSEVARHASTLPFGCYSRWDWDAVGGKDLAWDEARKAWNRTMSTIVRYSSRPEHDSEMLVEAEAMAGALRPDHQRVFDAWRAIRDTRPFPPSQRVVYDWPTVDAFRRAIEKLPEGTLVWYGSKAVAGLLLGVMDVFGPGELGPSHGRTAAVSIWAQGTGWNAQHYNKNLILHPGMGCGTWEQVIGRTHRTGQTQEITVAIASHRLGAFFKAKEDAEAFQDMHGQPQRILMAQWRPSAVELPGWSRP